MRSRSNPFMSVVEPIDSFQTVWCAPHSQIAERWPVRQIADSPMWTQIVHGSNVINRLESTAWRRPALLAIGAFPLLRAFLADRGCLGLLEETLFTATWGTRQVIK